MMLLFQHGACPPEQGIRFSRHSPPTDSDASCRDLEVFSKQHDIVPKEVLGSENASRSNFDEDGGDLRVAQAGGGRQT
jgi:hypothetical protein